MPWDSGGEDILAELEVYTLTMTASAGGAVAATTTFANAIRGFVVHIHIAEGGTTPTALWDFTLVDSNGVDLTNGNGVNQPAGDHDFFQTDLANGVACAGSMIFTASNMGNAGQAVITVYVARYS